LTEAAALRNSEKEARVYSLTFVPHISAHNVMQALFSAQTKLLADATTEVSELKTEMKENQHKVDRLRDYERQIEQLIKVQRLWYVIS
jgi:hypothetical protein